MKYVRETDGQDMIEVSPHRYVNRKAAKALGIVREDDDEKAEVGVAVGEPVEVRTSPPRKRAPTGGDKTGKPRAVKVQAHDRGSKPGGKRTVGPRKRVLTPRR